MSAQYDALVRLSQPLTYWPLGRRLGQEQVSGLHFTTFPTPGYRQGYETVDDYTEIQAGEVISRTFVSNAFNTMSVEFWFWWAGSLGSGDFQIFGNGSGASNGYTVGVTGSTGRLACVAQGNAVLASSARAIAPRTWNHFVIMRNAGVWQYYLNGELDTANGGVGINTPTGTTQLGASGNTGRGVRVRNLAIYHRILTPSEIRDHYQMGSANIGPVYVVGEATHVGDLTDSASIYVDIQIIGDEDILANDSATIYYDIRPSGTDSPIFVDASTIYYNIQIDSHDCLTKWDSTQLYARIYDRFETTANHRWHGTTCQDRFIAVAGDGLEEC